MERQAPYRTAPSAEEDEASEDDTIEPEILEFKFDFTPEYQDPLFKDKEFERAVIALYGAASLYFAWKCARKNTAAFKKLAQVNFSRQKQSSLATLYGTADGKEVVLVFNADVPAYQNHSFAVTLFEKVLRAKSVLVVTATSYQALGVPAGSEPPERCDIRRLRNSVAAPQQWRDLDAGNSVDGIAADVLAYAEVRGFAGEVLIAVLTDFELQADHVLVFDALKDLLPYLNEPGDDLAALKTITGKYNKLKFSNNIYL